MSKQINKKICMNCKSNINIEYIKNNNCPVCQEINSLVKQVNKGRFIVYNLLECIENLKEIQTRKFETEIVKPKISKEMLMEQIGKYCGLSKTRITHISYKVENKNIVTGLVAQRLKECFEIYNIEIDIKKIE